MSLWPFEGKRVFLALVCLLASAPGWAQAPAPIDEPAARVGTFKQLKGEVVQMRGSERLSPGAGTALREGDRIRTGAGSAAGIVLKDGTVLTVGPDSTVDLSRFQFDSTTHQGSFLLDLLQGSVRVVTGLLARLNPDRFQVRTPTAVVGVRGTDFIVEAEGGRGATAGDPPPTRRHSDLQAKP
jgi:hypothetical protein